ncbi:hypothetical protein CDCA_CDCA14G3781 [Cyanidium caldarium]|uniref:NAD-dependent epimerase/dehydratase domain-containing protein n=1 Tax=Cyanidium caldarium TaxID=2771 RepID=A0AAV9J048_CYACA|nr:hypothetical protein CDCA_CDCA14G3781 [Cyanidium caldarium]
MAFVQVNAVSALTGKNARAGGRCVSFLPRTAWTGDRWAMGRRGSLNSSWRPVRAGRAVVGAQSVGRSGLVCRDTTIIVNNPTGGHAEIGLHLAQQMLAVGHRVAILVTAPREQCAQTQPTAEMIRMAESSAMKSDVDLMFGDPTDPASLTGLLPPRRPSAGRVAALVDNASKSAQEAMLLHKYAMGVDADRYLYVSSCGIYVPSEQAPFVEGDVVDREIGQAQVESLFRADKAIPFAAFRPMYVLGPFANKHDYTNFFFDRLTRQRPIPLPSSGEAFVSLTHAADLARMLSCAILASPELIGGHAFNAVSPRYITLTGLADLCHQVVNGKEGGKAPVVYYDAKERGVDPKKSTGLPFRIAYPFLADPGHAIRQLRWSEAFGRTLHTTLQECYQAYQNNGLAKRQVDLSGDDAIMQGAHTVRK